MTAHAGWCSVHGDYDKPLAEGPCTCGASARRTMTFTLKTHSATGALLERSEYETAEAATAWFDAECSVALENGGTAELTGPKGERIGFYEAPKPDR